MVKIKYPGISMLLTGAIPESIIESFREYERKECKRRIEESLAREIGLTYSEFKILQNMPFCEFPKSFNVHDFHLSIERHLSKND